MAVLLKRRHKEGEETRMAILRLTRTISRMTMMTSMVTKMTGTVMTRRKYVTEDRSMSSSRNSNNIDINGDTTEDHSGWRIATE